MAGTNVPRTTATTNCAPDLSLHSTVEVVASEERDMLFACLSTYGGRNVGCFNTAPAKLYDGYDRHHVGCYRRRGQSSPARDSCPLYVQGF